MHKCKFKRIFTEFELISDESAIETSSKQKSIVLSSNKDKLIIKKRDTKYMPHCIRKTAKTK